MPRLNKFSWNIDTCVDKKNIEIAFSSNEDIQRSFTRKQYGPVSSLVETFTTRESEDECHIYSLPYQFENFCSLSNSFQGGMFDSVLSLMMADLYPFEHNFFKVISQSFFLLKQLIIFNDASQKDKQLSKTLITFSHLIILNLDSAHTDYAEQFLVAEHYHLPCLLDLIIGYESLALVTNNFTNDATRLTCSKLTSLCIDFFSQQTDAELQRHIHSNSELKQQYDVLLSIDEATSIVENDCFIPMSTPGYDYPTKDHSGPAACQCMKHCSNLLHQKRRVKLLQKKFLI
ncbi:unnamed protein product [Rotaria socialis]|uniref:Uncharacterized protein n=1 Tax=Rotaria socialis TaxID=392032 RepID=A0A821JGE0_9BILA|nr:unnamed protein product [Rotaria socialis]